MSAASSPAAPPSMAVDRGDASAPASSAAPRIARTTMICRALFGCLLFVLYLLLPRGMLGDIFLVAFLLFACVANCWWFCSPHGLARHRREKEEEARRRMAEYMERVQKEASENNDGAPEQAMVHREYECSYSGSTRGIGEGYGHAELHLSVSPTVDAAGRRTISGCGMREWEYTEITGYVDANGNAEWTERSTREIGYHPPRGHRDEFNVFNFLTNHVGPISLQSKGRFDGDLQSFEGQFYGRDECNCQRCQAFWARLPWVSNVESRDLALGYPRELYGEPVRWCPDEERRKIGEYILFRQKDAPSGNGGESEEDIYHQMA